jgi:serine/threonine-protein kinase
MLLVQVVSEEPRPPRRLNDRIPRSLEAICLKAMAKEPRRRYRNAASLAADLRRWRAGEAVRARPAGAVELLWRGIKRHPALVLVAGLAAAALVVLVGKPAAALLAAVAVGAGLYALHQGKVATQLTQAAEQMVRDQQRTAAVLQTAVSQCQQLREERDRLAAAGGEVRQSRDRLHRLAHAVVFDLQDQLASLAGSGPARAQLVRLALEYLELLGEQGGSESTILRELAAGYEKVGDVQQALGQTREALASYRRSLAIEPAAPAAGPESAVRCRGRAVCFSKVGNLQRTLGQLPEALASFRESLRITEALAEAEPAQAQTQRDLAASCFKLGQVAAQLGGDAATPRADRLLYWSEAAAQHRRSRDILRAMQARGILPAADAGLLDMLAAEVARCEDVLAQGKSAPAAARQ